MPFMKDGKRDYQAEKIWEKEEKPNRVKQRATRNAARAMMMEEGRAKKGDGKDVDHKTPLSKGGDNSRKNLRMLKSTANRSVNRKANGSLK